jgi:hypothetical protein
VAKRRGKPWRTTRPDLAARRRPDLVDRDFSAGGADELWVADLTYLRCWEGVVFFAFIIDAHSRRIVGWQSRRTCAPRSCWMRCGWLCTSADPAPTSSWSITAIAAVDSDSTGRRNSCLAVNVSAAGDGGLVLASRWARGGGAAVVAEARP